jgi:hypothetical protein
MQLSDKEFATFKTHQYCDNPQCRHYGQVGGLNLQIKTRKNGQIYCNSCESPPFSVRRGTMFFGLRTPMDKIISVLGLLASGIGVNAVCREQDVTADSLRAWIVLAANQVTAFTLYMQQNMHLEQVQIDEFWSFIKKKKENLTELEIFEATQDPEKAENQGDMWTFAAVLPESGFIHTVHSSERTVEEATLFIGEIKDKSDGLAPFFQSDSWFYMTALINNYSTYQSVPYKGIGRPPHPIQVVDPHLRYAQVHKERNSKGKIEKVSTRIVLGEIDHIFETFEQSDRSKTVNTDFVESRNGNFRKDNARLIRKTLCHSKKAIYHKAHISFLTQVYNYTRPIDNLKILTNPDAKRFEPKFTHRTPAMVEKIVDKILSLKELLSIRPQIVKNNIVISSA